MTRIHPTWTIILLSIQACHHATKLSDNARNYSDENSKSVLPIIKPSISTNKLTNNKLRYNGLLNNAYLGNGKQLVYSLYNTSDILINNDATLWHEHHGYVSYINSEIGSKPEIKVINFYKKNGFFKVGFFFPTPDYLADGLNLGSTCQIVLTDTAFIRVLGLTEDIRVEDNGDDGDLYVRFVSLLDSAFTDSVAHIANHYPPAFYRTPAILLNKAGFLNELGFDKESILLLDAVIQHFPTCAQAYNDRANCYWNLHQADPMRRDYRRYLDLVQQQHLPLAADDRALISTRLQNGPPR